MRKILFITLAITFILNGGGISWAQPRYTKDIDLKFNNATKQLSIFVPHKVNDPKYHYIPDVTVYLNDNQKVHQYLTRQDNDEGLTLLYRIPEADTGDVISVTASSNMTRTVYRNKVRVE